MQIIGPCLATGTLLAKAARIGILIVAAVLVSASIATSVTRQAPRAIQMEGAAENDPEAILTESGDDTLITLDEATAPVTPTPTAPAGPLTVTGPFVWNTVDKAWEEPDKTSFPEDQPQFGAVPILVHVSGVAPGASYRMTLEYADCGGGYETSFDRLAGTTSDLTPWLTAPAPGRARPDFTIAAPSENRGAQAAPISVWGATASAGDTPGAMPVKSCPGKPDLELRLEARDDEISLGLGAHLLRKAAPAVGGLAPLTVHVERIP
jgi:hypothetical protein